MLIVSIGALPFEGEVDVNARATRRGIPAAVKWGGLVALAWATLTIFSGGGSAHADEQPDGPGRINREDLRRSLGVLQALRLALMQFMFLRAVRIPAFSRSNDISRDDVLQMVFSLRIDDALAQLRRAYPIASPSLDDYTVEEPADYPDLSGHSYAGIRQELIDPIEEAHQLNLRIGLSIANYFGAHG